MTRLLKEKCLKIFNLHPSLVIEKILTNDSKKEQNSASLDQCSEEEIREFTELNEFISIAAMLFGFVQLIFVYNVFYSYKNGEDADDNPWDGGSREWATSSPPPHNSFVEIPTLKVAEEKHK